jgi:hypothetical protein
MKQAAASDQLADTQHLSCAFLPIGIAVALGPAALRLVVVLYLVRWPSCWWLVYAPNIMCWHIKRGIPNETRGALSPSFDCRSDDRQSRAGMA